MYLFIKICFKHVIMKSTWYNIVDENKNNNKINTFKTEQAEA